MYGTKYLSAVLDVSLFLRNMLNLITAPCGCGKTTAAINLITPLAQNPCRAIYLIDTRLGMERLGNNAALTKPYALYFETAGCKNAAFLSEPEHDKVVVTTYAQFGVWVDQEPDFASRFDVIICDESHNLVNFANIPAQGNEINYTKRALQAIGQAAQADAPLVVAISATPDKTSEIAPIYDVPIDDTDLRRYTIEKTQYVVPDQFLQHLPEGKIGVIYHTHITSMIKTCDTLKTLGRKPVCIWSLSSPDHPITEEQLAARQYIIDKEKIPPQYDTIIINDSCATSVNLRGRIDFFLIVSTSKNTIDQVRGRYRDDLPALYLPIGPDDVGSVPEEFLGRRLFTEEKKRLRENITTKDGKGHYMSYAILFARLQEKGYTITEGRQDNRTFHVITAPAQDANLAALS